MKIDRIEQFHIQMPLKHHFETSFGRMTAMDKIIVAVYADGLIGYGESPVDTEPFYSYEDIETCWHIQHDYLIPMLLGKHVAHATDIDHQASCLPEISVAHPVLRPGAVGKPQV